MPESSDASLLKKPHLDAKPDGCQVGRKSAMGASTSTTDPRKKRSYGKRHS